MAARDVPEEEERGVGDVGGCLHVHLHVPLCFPAVRWDSLIVWRSLRIKCTIE